MNAKSGSLHAVRRPAAHTVQSSQLHSISGWYQLCLRLSDIALTEVALWLAAQTRHVLPFGPALDSEGWLSPQAFVLAPIVVMLTYTASGLYRAEQLQSLRTELRTALRATLISTVVLAGCMYFVNRDLSRWLFVYYGVFQLLLVVLMRVTVHGVFRLAGVPIKQPRRVAIVGTGPVGQEIAQRLARLHDAHYEVIGFIAEDRERAGEWEQSSDRLGLLDRIETIIRAQKIDELLVALPPEAHARLAQIMKAVHDVPVQVTVVPDYFEVAYLYARSGELVGLPVVYLKEPVLTPWQHAVKRVSDLIGGTVLLLALTPVLAISALAIKIDSPGPILYRQRRVGEGGKEFFMLKLRTMVCGADRDEVHMLLTDTGTLRFNKSPDDPRVTRVGKFLRRWSIDELPQLINVLQGEMSLIGPRPELPSLVERYSAWQRKRFAVPQGMTGWWQVNGRPQDVEQKVELDLYYVRSYSLGLDIWIMVKTIGAVLSRRGAY
jgi:exopolysaccharide biosynthesis polyprenyl glycosylphosphotransferase